MVEYGLTVKQDQGSSRVELQCPHQNGLLYVVPAEATWVCVEELRHAHALAGFLGELVKRELPQVRELMQRWGLYYRERPIDNVATTDSNDSTGSDSSASQSRVT